MKKLVLIRHGETDWNKEGRFLGWTDIGLNEKGKQEALEAGQMLKREGFLFDLAFTSMLKRAIKTLWIVLEEMDLMWIPIQSNWHLNDRHWGKLQGLNKGQMAGKPEMTLVRLWGRDYNLRPPALSSKDIAYPGFDSRYANLKPDEIPLGESFKETVERILPYWHETIAPIIKAGKRVVISAHGNSLRALIKYLNHVSDNDILDFKIPTAIPLVYELSDDLEPLSNYYLYGSNKV